MRRHGLSAVGADVSALHKMKHIVRLVRKYGPGAVVVGLLAPYANAAADADISAGVTVFTDSWAAIKTPLIAVGTFLVVWGLFKKLRRA